MNLTVHEASLFVHRLSERIKRHNDVEIVLAPGMLALQPLSLQIHKAHFKLSSQNLYWRDAGAYTGEVSAAQLRGLVDYAIIGHSERRHVFGEHAKDIRFKVQAAIRNNIQPILCIGETATERADGETNDILHDQLVSGLTNVTSEDLKHVVVAYEPVWAISNGANFAQHKTPTPTDITKVVHVIRSQIKHLYGEVASHELRILYGGSVNTSNAGSYLNVQGIDGLLIGGASLDVNQFDEIVEKAHGGNSGKVSA